MTKLDKHIRDFVVWTLEHYEEDKRQLEEYKKDFIPSGISAYSLTGGITPGEAGRPTERTAIKMATSPYLINLERSVAAVTRVYNDIDPYEAKLIEMVYFKKTHTVIGAGMVIGWEKDAAYNHINRILKWVAREMGLINI